uniref:Uncharacterized protein n=1 Tax=Lygus hesperus TaxID=30085 RepID=A0A0A9WKH0_LYGHE
MSRVNPVPLIRSSSVSSSSSLASFASCANMNKDDVLEYYEKLCLLFNETPCQAWVDMLGKSSVSSVRSSSERRPVQRRVASSRRAGVKCTVVAGTNENNNITGSTKNDMDECSNISNNKINRTL